MTEQQYGDIPDDEANRRGKRYIDHLTKALSINPNLIDAGNWLHIALQSVGDFKGSLEVLIDIAERDPLYRPAFSNAIISFNAFGKPDEAEALLQRIEAFELAHAQASSGSPENLFYLLNRSDRSKEVTDFLEERWLTRALVIRNASTRLCF